MKFAYLILAHDNFSVLNRLIGMLDDSRNDIFIHFDKKLKNLPDINTESSGLHIIPDRIDVRWGTTSQIKAIYKLLDAAYTFSSYDFFFVISGTHLPLKNQDYIHQYFSKYTGNTVIRRWNSSEGEIDFKLRRIHIGIDNFQSPNRHIKSVVQLFWRIGMYLQKHLGIRIHKGETFVKADEWVVLTAPHVRHMLDVEHDIQKKYRHTFCSDEFYLASELMAFDKEHIIDDQNILFMHFDADRPLVIEREEYVQMMDSPYIFARKFTDETI